MYRLTVNDRLLHKMGIEIDNCFYCKDNTQSIEHIYIY